MTGFGRAEQSVGDKTFLVDIKSLNGKSFELSLRLPAFLKPFEFEIRKTLSEGLMRGSVDCIISLKDTGGAKPVSINTSLAKAYCAPIKELAAELGLDDGDLLNTILKLPEVITPSGDTLTDAEWLELQGVIRTAIGELNAHRRDEGAALQLDIESRIRNIAAHQESLEVFAPARKEKMREGLQKILHEATGGDGYDTNRLEQELIYYIEKIDISEEGVRLRNHCDYFHTILQESEPVKGKKLSFVLQEIGREINTTGSKAYDAAIQKLVVQMKDELEKAKEQVLNVL